MPAVDLSTATDWLDILRSDIDENGTVTLQLGDVANGVVYDPEAVAMFPPGFLARPADPDPGRDACQAFVWKSSGPDTALAYRDIRSQKLAGALKPGESCMYAPAGQSRIMCKADGTIAAITTADNTPTGTNVGWACGPDGIKFFGPWGVITLDANGFTVAVKSGAFISLDADGNVTVAGKNASIVAGAVLLGAKASPATTAAYLVGATPTPSTSVFISP